MVPFYGLVVSTLLAVTPFASSAPTASDPCAAIAGKTYNPPSDVLACLKSFPFNETIRHNVITTASRVFDFFTFGDYYLFSPPPFEDSFLPCQM